MRQGVGARHRPRGEMPSNESPRMQVGRETFGHTRDVKQHRFAAFLNGEAAQHRGVHFWRTEQLRGGPQPVEMVGMSSKTERNADFFVGNFGRVVWQRRVKFTLKVARAAFNGNFK